MLHLTSLEVGFAQRVEGGDASDPLGRRPVVGRASQSLSAGPAPNRNAPQRLERAGAFGFLKSLTARLPGR